MTGNPVKRYIAARSNFSGNVYMVPPKFNIELAALVDPIVSPSSKKWPKDRDKWIQLARHDRLGQQHIAMITIFRADI